MKIDGNGSQTIDDVEPKSEASGRNRSRGGTPISDEVSSSSSSVSEMTNNNVTVRDIKQRLRFFESERLPAAGNPNNVNNNNNTALTKSTSVSTHSRNAACFASNGSSSGGAKPTPLRRASASETRLVSPVVVARNVANFKNNDNRRFDLAHRFLSDVVDAKNEAGAGDGDDDEDVTVVSGHVVPPPSVPQRQVSVLDMVLRFGETNGPQANNRDVVRGQGTSPSRPPRRKESTASASRWISGSSSSGCDDEGFHDQQDAEGNGDVVVVVGVGPGPSSPSGASSAFHSDADVDGSSSSSSGGATDSNRQSPETPVRSVAKTTAAADPDALLSAVVAAAPLPPGPPPKKPPRTFAHDFYVKSRKNSAACGGKERRSSSCGNQSDGGSVGPSPKASGGDLGERGESSLPFLGQLAPSPTPRTARAMTVSVAPNKENGGGGGGRRQKQVTALPEVLKRCRSEEHIYAVPYADLNSSSSASRRSQNRASQLPSSVYVEIEEDVEDGHVGESVSMPRELHYSCVPVYTPQSNGATVVVVNPDGNGRHHQQQQQPPAVPAPPPPSSGPPSLPHPFQLLSNGHGTISTVVLTSSAVAVAGPNSSTSSSGRPAVCKNVSLKRRPPVNGNKSWARRCLEKTAGRSLSGVVVVAAAAAATAAQAQGQQTQPQAAVSRNNSDVSSLSSSTVTAASSSSSTATSSSSSSSTVVVADGGSAGADRTSFRRDLEFRLRSSSLGADGGSRASVGRTKSVDSDGYAATGANVSADAGTTAAKSNADVVAAAADGRNTIAGFGGSSGMDAAVGIPPRRAGRSGGFFKSSETSSTTLGSKDDKRPPLPPPSARDRLAGLNFTIQSLVEKARKRCNFGKTQSAAKLNPSAVIVNGGKTTTVNNISNNNVVHLRSSTSSPVLNLGNGGLAAKRRSGGAWGLGVNGNGHSNGAESPSSRTPSTSSSGAEDSDLTNDDDEDSEKDDDADVVNPQFSFTELRERWKERERVVENRKSYVRRVSSTVSSVYRKNLLAGCNNRVFDCVLVVGLYHDTRRDVYKPFVRKVFPSDAPFPENIALFCFPDACNWRGGNRTPAGGGSDSASSLTGSDLCGNISACNSYSIVLTSEKGERTFGYCRRIVPGSNPNPNPNPNRGDRASDAAKHHDDGVVRNHAPLGDDLPLAYCVLSKYRSHGFYDKFLSVLTSCHGCADAQMQTFLTLVGRKAMPSPGQSLVLPSVGAGLRAASPESSSSSSAGGTPNSNNNSSLAPAPTANGQPSPAATIARAYDERLEESDLAFVVANLDHSLLLKIFGAILLERKVLLASTSMKKLSSCIQGLSGLLYPFSWEHVLVPILPITLKDVVAAPSPFLIGLLVPAALQQHSGYDFTRDLLGSQELNSEGLMVVDLDKNRLVQSVGDESTILPRKVRKCLTTALSLVSELTEPGDPARNVLISEIFISVFVELCGHYKSHIVAGPDGKRVFQADTFLAAVKNSSSRLFLAWFVETAMFSIFIDNRILQTGSRDNDLFDYRVLEQQSDGGGKNIFKTMKQFSKTVKTMSDKWREWKASNGQISSPVS